MEKEQFIKTKDLCDRCKYSFALWCSGRYCAGCECDFTDERGEPSCRCLTIENNTPCPYFVEGGAQ